MIDTKGTQGERPKENHAARLQERIAELEADLAELQVERDGYRDNYGRKLDDEKQLLSFIYELGSALEHIFPCDYECCCDQDTGFECETCIASRALVKFIKYNAIGTGRGDMQ